MRLHNGLAVLGHDESGEPQGHGLGVEQNHAIGGSYGELWRQWHGREARYLADDSRRAAAIGEHHVGLVTQEDAFDGAFAGNEWWRLRPAAQQLLRLGFERGAGAGTDGLSASEHCPRVIAARVRAGSRGAEAYRRVEQAVEHVGWGQAGRRPRDGAEVVAREVNDQAFGMAGGEAARLLHVG